MLLFLIANSFRDIFRNSKSLYDTRYQPTYIDNSIFEESSEELVVLNESNIFMSIENLLLYAEIIDEHFVYIDDEYDENYDDILMLRHNQHLTEIKRTKDSHQANWIPYHYQTMQQQKPFKEDVIISSIERI